MRILVSGAAGFVGSHVADRLIDVGHEVVGLDAFIPYYPRPVKEANLAGARESSAFTFVERDLRTDPLEDVIEGIDAVVHEAAMAGLMRSWTELDLYASCNLVGTQRLLDAAIRAGVRRFVHVSTSSVYGRYAVGDEHLPTIPTSPYGITKLAAEHLVHAVAARADIETVVLRYFSIYGPRQRPDMAYHIFCEALHAGRPVVVFGDGQQSRSNTYIDDCVAGTIAALTDAPAGHTFNIGGGQEIRLLDAIAIIADELGVTPPIDHAPARPGDQVRTKADTSRAWAAFGYAAKVTPEEGLRRQVAWHRERWQRDERPGRLRA